MLSLAAFALGQGNPTVTAEARWPAEPQILVVWSFTKLFADLYHRDIKYKKKNELDEIYLDEATSHSICENISPLHPFF